MMSRVRPHRRHALDWLAVPYVAAGGAAAGFVTGGVIAATHGESYWVGVRLPAP